VPETLKNKKTFNTFFMSLSFVEACVITGFFGDIGLQILNTGNWGLDGYFSQHGNPVAPFIAAGMMGIFGTLWNKYNKDEPPTIKQAMIYGGILDLLFRFLRPMSSLDGYYGAMPIWLSFIWGGIPFVMALQLSLMVS